MPHSRSANYIHYTIRYFQILVIYTKVNDLPRLLRKKQDIS